MKKILKKTKLVKIIKDTKSNHYFFEEKMVNYKDISHFLK